MSTKPEIKIGEPGVTITGKTPDKKIFSVAFDGGEYNGTPETLKIVGVHTHNDYTPIMNGGKPAEVAAEITTTKTKVKNITTDIDKILGGKPKRKSSKNRRKSKGGRKPKRKSSKNRK